MGILKGNTVNVSEITFSEIDEMYNLMSIYYDNLEKTNFEEDLREKDHILIFKDQDSNIKGFTTLKLVDYSLNGENIKGIFSGDTIIDKSYWGYNDLASAWLKFALAEGKKYKYQNFYWFLISKGYKTYRTLPVYFKEFYPRLDVEIPDNYKRIMNSFATARYPKYYNRLTGIVEYNGTKDRLKSGISDINECRSKNKDIEFFTKINPGHITGNDLVCIARIAPDNIRDRIRKALFEENK